MTGESAGEALGTQAATQHALRGLDMGAAPMAASNRPPPGPGMQVCEHTSLCSCVSLRYSNACWLACEATAAVRDAALCATHRSWRVQRAY